MIPVKTPFPFDIDTVYDALRHLTVRRAANFLVYTFDAGEHEILDLSKNHAKWATTTIEYALNCDEQLLATDAKIVFWGGPPDDCEWYSGSLLALLVDRLFYNVAIGNHELVERFMKAVDHD